MRVKRRRFLQTLAVAPAVTSAAPQRGAAAGASTAAAPKLTNATMDADAETRPHFFSAVQFATLRRLGSLFMPPRKGQPGALEAGAPEFVDFLVSASAADRQQLYRHGLDILNASATTRFHKTFAELSDPEADTILKPLVVTIAWVMDRPADPMEHFVAQVHDDLRTATVNSLEWAQAAQASGRRGRNTGVDVFIRPIDPVYRG